MSDIRDPFSPVGAGSFPEVSSPPIAPPSSLPSPFSQFTDPCQMDLMRDSDNQPMTMDDEEEEPVRNEEEGYEEKEVKEEVKIESPIIVEEQQMTEEYTGVKHEDKDEPFFLEVKKQEFEQQLEQIVEQAPIWKDDFSGTHMVFGAPVCFSSHRRNVHVVVPILESVPDKKEEERLKQMFKEVLMNIRGSPLKLEPEDSILMENEASDFTLFWNDAVQMMTKIERFCDADSLQESNSTRLHAYGLLNRAFDGLEKTVESLFDLDRFGILLDPTKCNSLPSSVYVHFVPESVVDDAYLRLDLTPTQLNAVLTAPEDDPSCCSYDTYAKRLHQRLHESSTLLTSVISKKKRIEPPVVGYSQSVIPPPVAMVDYFGFRFLVEGRTGFLSEIPHPQISSPEDPARVAKVLSERNPWLLCSSFDASELKCFLHCHGLRMNQLGELGHCLLEACSSCSPAASFSFAQEWLFLVKSEMVARAFCKIMASVYRFLVKKQATKSVFIDATVQYLNAFFANFTIGLEKGRAASFMASNHTRNNSQFTDELWRTLNIIVSHKYKFGDTIEPTVLSGSDFAFSHVFFLISEKLGLQWSAEFLSTVRSQGKKCLSNGLVISDQCLTDIIPRFVHECSRNYAKGVLSMQNDPLTLKQPTFESVSTSTSFFLHALSEQPLNPDALRHLARSYEDAFRVLISRNYQQSSQASDSYTAQTMAHMPSTKARSFYLIDDKDFCLEHARLLYELCKSLHPCLYTMIDYNVFDTFTNSGSFMLPPDEIDNRAQFLLRLIEVDRLVSIEKRTEAFVKCKALVQSSLFQRGISDTIRSSLYNVIAVASCLVDNDAYRAGKTLIKSVMIDNKNIVALANCAQFCKHILKRRVLARLFTELVYEIDPQFSFNDIIHETEQMNDDDDDDNNESDGVKDEENMTD